MKRNIMISIIIVIVIAGGIASSSYFYHKPSEQGNQWMVSGPFAINKPVYKLGEDIFISVNGLKPGEVGNMLIIRPGEKTWKIIPFNGTSKSDFNYYVKPDTSANAGIYKAEDLVGKWRVVFEGVKYEPIHFEYINEFIEGGQVDLVTINRTATIGPTEK
ncbi:MAG: hypothetical protein HZA82_03050 [Thaumarchaeota archaeon]|nr:hypothetical protein [Nitrososphaerota archaeon]